MIPLAAVILAVSGIVSSCSAAATIEREPVELTLKVRDTQLSKQAGSSFVSVTADGDWTLNFEDPVVWARLSNISGTGNKADIVLSWDENKDIGDRSFTIVLSDSHSILTEKLIQPGIGKQDTGDVNPDAVTGWMELSSIPEGTFFISHPMEIDGKQYRNYSYCWDSGDYLAPWVAYPLNSALLKGSAGRTDDWNYDPKVPQNLQPCYFKGIGGYQRGHQIPSADRQVARYNRQTFYFTNMTPQNGSLNTGIWSNLENYVRERSRCVDTLYVVTGCTVDSSPAKAYDNEGKSVSVPSGYYKALLAYSKSGSIGSATGGYIGIAFYFKNASCSGSYFNYSMTIAELEELTGVDFFVNLPAAIGQTKATKVESTIDNWWK